MNEAMQEVAGRGGFDVAFEVIDWAAMTQRRARGAQSPDQVGVHGAEQLAGPGPIRISASPARSPVDRIPPRGINWGNVQAAGSATRCCAAIRAEFDLEKQNTLIAELHARMVEDATWLFVVHDLNPRAMSPQGEGLRAGAELDPGPDADRDGVSAPGAVRRRTAPGRGAGQHLPVAGTVRRKWRDRCRPRSFAAASWMCWLRPSG